MTTQPAWIAAALAPALPEATEASEMADVRADIPLPAVPPPSGSPPVVSPPAAGASTTEPVLDTGEDAAESAAVPAAHPSPAASTSTPAPLPAPTAAVASSTSATAEDAGAVKDAEGKQDDDVGLSAVPHAVVIGAPVDELGEQDDVSMDLDSSERAPSPAPADNSRAGDAFDDDDDDDVPMDLEPTERFDVGAFAAGPRGASAGVGAHVEMDADDGIGDVYTPSPTPSPVPAPVSWMPASSAPQATMGMIVIPPPSLQPWPWQPPVPTSDFVPPPPPSSSRPPPPPPPPPSGSAVVPASLAGPGRPLQSPSQVAPASSEAWRTSSSDVSPHSAWGVSQMDAKPSTSSVSPAPGPVGVGATAPGPVGVGATAPGPLPAPAPGPVPSRPAVPAPAPTPSRPAVPAPAPTPSRPPAPAPAPTPSRPAVPAPAPTPSRPPAPAPATALSWAPAAPERPSDRGWQQTPPDVVARSSDAAGLWAPPQVISRLPGTVPAVRSVRPPQPPLEAATPAGDQSPARPWKWEAYAGPRPSPKVEWWFDTSSTRAAVANQGADRSSDASAQHASERGAQHWNADMHEPARAGPGTAMASLGVHFEPDVPTVLGGRRWSAPALTGERHPEPQQAAGPPRMAAAVPAIRSVHPGTRRDNVDASAPPTSSGSSAAAGPARTMAPPPGPPLGTMPAVRSIPPGAPASRPTILPWTPAPAWRSVPRPGPPSEPRGAVPAVGTASIPTQRGDGTASASAPRGAVPTVGTASIPTPRGPAPTVGTASSSAPPAPAAALARVEPTPTPAQPAWSKRVEATPTPAQPAPAKRAEATPTPAQPAPAKRVEATPTRAPAPATTAPTPVERTLAATAPTPVPAPAPSAPTPAMPGAAPAVQPLAGSAGPKPVGLPAEPIQGGGSVPSQPLRADDPAFAGVSWSMWVDAIPARLRACIDENRQVDLKLQQLLADVELPPS